MGDSEMQHFEIKWTEKNETHIARHGISPREVEEVLSSKPLGLVQGRESTLLALGQTYAGRYLMVVLAEAEDGRFYVVTSRDMTLHEVRKFRRKG